MCECCAYPHPAPPGIPELQSHEDVDYLRQTLFLDMTEEQAAVAFMEEVCLVWGERMGKDDLTDSPACAPSLQIDLALKDSWSVRMNWMAHIMAH